jgi:hypothetical protein
LSLQYGWLSSREGQRGSALVSLEAFCALGLHRFGYQ